MLASISLISFLGLPGCGGNTSPGDSTSIGGSSNTGLNTTGPSITGGSNAIGGATHTGGMPATGGALSTGGGFAATGGTLAITCTTTPTAACADNCAVPSNAIGSFEILCTGGGGCNYFMLGNYAGYGYVYISPTANSVMPPDWSICPEYPITPNSVDTLVCG